nr:protein ROS1A isoform X3 [Aegilops tauschii subsp. strangulata]
MDEGSFQHWPEEWFQTYQMNSPIGLGTNNEAGPAEGTGFSRKADKIPKSKKHRPKVVKEKKIAKIQKYTTAKHAKEKETHSTGKRKYVRKKGLNATTNQPPAEDSDMQNRVEKLKARRSLKFNEDDMRKNADLASQAQVTEASFNPEDPRSSIYAAERTHAQVACHWGGYINFLEGNNVPNNIQRMGSHQLESLEVGPTLHYSIDEDCSIALPGKQPRYSTAEHTQLPSGTENPFIENYIPSGGIHQLQYLEKRMVKGPESVPETHGASAYDDTVNNYCIAIHDEQITHTGVEAVGKPVSKSSRAKRRLLDASGENKEAYPTKKPKRGRPRKEESNGKPKGRGTRKETVRPAKRLSSKDKCTINEPISCGSELSAGATTKATTSESKRSVERPSVLEISDHDNYRSIGFEHIDGAITEVIALSADPLDAVIEKFKLLYTSKSDKVMAAACNKGTSDALVPFMRNANKRRSRPRVDIDPVTSLMWNLRIAPNMNDDAGGMDKDKEKLLDEERRVFRGRINAFIARMHLIQGDRRFSPWKGSVVDSVVGVYLTQNVADHLSSSAFMAVAAKFPIKPEGPEGSTAEMSHMPPGQNDSCSGLFGDSFKLKGKFSVEEILNTEFHEGSNSNELIGSFSGDGFNFAAGECSVPYRESLIDLHENRQSKFVVPESGIASVVEAEVPMEDAISSQNSSVSSQHSPDYPFHRTDPMGFSLLPYFPEKDHMLINLSNRMTSSTGHAEHPPIQDFQNMHNDMVGSSEYGVNLLPVPGVNKDVLLDLNRTYQAYASYLQNGHVDFPFVSHLDNSFCTGLDSMFHPNITQPEASFYQLPSASSMSNRNKTREADCSSNVLYCMDESLVQQKSHFPTEPSQNGNFSPIMKQNFQPLISSVDESLSKEQLFCEYKFSSKDIEAPFAQQHECSNSQEVYRTRAKQMGGQSGCSQPQLGNNIKLQAETCENYCSSNLCENQNAHSQVSQGVADPIRKSKVSRKGSSEVPTDESKGKTVCGPTEETYDWEKIRKELFGNNGDKPRSPNTKDSVDWEAVRQADVKAISETIRERGLNNMLAGRIKEFLNRLVRDHGSIDLEWLRDLEPEKANNHQAKQGHTSSTGAVQTKHKLV